MPRKSSETRPHPPAPARTPAPVPGYAPTPHTSNTSVGMLGSSLLQGAGWGVGTSLGNRAVNAVLGTTGGTVGTDPSPAPNAVPTREMCNELLHRYRECLSNDYVSCGPMFDDYLECLDKHKKHVAV